MTATTSSTLDQLQSTVENIAAEVNAIDTAAEIVRGILDGNDNDELDSLSFTEDMCRVAEDADATDDEIRAAMDLLTDLDAVTINNYGCNVADAFVATYGYGVTYTGRRPEGSREWDVTGAELLLAGGGPTVVAVWDLRGFFTVRGTWGDDVIEVRAWSVELGNELEVFSQVD